MGKIRVKSFGDQEEEEKAKKRTAKRAEQKAEQKRVKEEASAGSTEDISPTEDQAPVEAAREEKPKVKKESSYKKKNQKRSRSQSYQEKLSQVDQKQTYSLSDGLSLLEKVHMAKFDESVELHINTLTKGLSGNMTLPHGSGKKTRVAIADDPILAEVEKGKINFDILLAHPSMMPKLAKVAKILGPRGLMPNPKNGTISPTPEAIAKKYEGGQMNFKTEAAAPIIHLVVGKLSFGDKKLSENIDEAVKSIKRSNIVDITLKSTMSPGIKIKL